MPTLAIELDDKGELIGDAPVELASIFKRIEAEHHKVGYGKGVEQAAKDARKQIEETIELEKKRLAAMEPLEKERVARIEQENQALASRMADLSKESDRTMKSREESHAREIVQRTEQLRRRDERIHSLTRGQVRVEAVAAGARDESLDELEIIIGNFIGFDDDMMPFIKGQDGSPMTTAGKPVTINAFVKQYLDAHAHHRKATTGRGGDARGGAAARGHGHGANGGNAEAARARVENGDRSIDAINDLFNATRGKSA